MQVFKYVHKISVPSTVKVANCLIIMQLKTLKKRKDFKFLKNNNNRITKLIKLMLHCEYFSNSVAAQHSHRHRIRNSVLKDYLV